MSGAQRAALVAILATMALGMFLVALSFRVEPPACVDVPTVKADPRPFKVRPPGWHMP